MTPIEWINEFSVNTGTAADGFQSEAQTIGLSNGNFLVAWTTADFSLPSDNQRDIFGKIYNAEGILVRNSYRINTTRSVDNESNFDVQPTNDGGFILVYLDQDGDSSDIVWERKNVGGNNTNSATIDTETSADDRLFNPQVAVNLINNSSVVTYTDDFNSGATEDLDVEGQAVSATGVLGAQFNAGTNSGERESASDLAILGNGNYVSVYEQDDSAGLRKVEFRIFSPAGSLIASDEVPPGVGGTSNRFPKVASLANGNFVVTWDEAPPSGSLDRDIKARIYSPTGTLIGSTILVANSTDDENEPAIAALRDGDFVIAWDNQSDNTLEARRFNSNGTSDGSTFIVTSEDIYNPHVGTTGDGRILFSWNEFNAPQVFASIWDPRNAVINATDYDNTTENFVNSNTITTRPTASTINGNLGVQTLLGQSGDDTFVREQLIRWRENEGRACG